MSRILRLTIQFSVLLAIAIVVLVLHEGIWASDTIVVWAAALAVALSSITAGQIVTTLRPKQHLATVSATRPQRAANAGAGHTARFKLAVDEDKKQTRERERKERARLNLEADLRRMRGEDG